MGGASFHSTLKAIEPSPPVDPDGIGEPQLVIRKSNKIANNKGYFFIIMSPPSLYFHHAPVIVPVPPPPPPSLLPPLLLGLLLPPPPPAAAAAPPITASPRTIQYHLTPPFSIFSTGISSSGVPERFGLAPADELAHAVFRAQYLLPEVPRGEEKD